MIAPDNEWGQHEKIQARVWKGSDGDVYIQMELPDRIFDAVKKEAITARNDLKIIVKSGVALFLDREGTV